MTWTAERRRQQSEAIRQWQPWQHSTGPRTEQGKAKVARNAYKGGEWKMLREIAALVAGYREELKAHKEAWQR